MKIKSYMKQTAAMQNTFSIVLQCGEVYLMPFPLLFLIDSTIAALDWHIYILSMSALLPCLSVFPLRTLSHFFLNLNLHRVPQYLLLDYRRLLFAETLRISIIIHCLFLDPVLAGNVQTSPSESISHVLAWHNLAWVGKHKGKDHCTTPKSLQMCHTYCGAGGKHAWQIVINICHLQLRGCNKQ